ncbi:hypothetical protein [Granulicella aggregans]|uniref:hypothetical protein n=1 Tax=Granulicella aggregans TaxID=474949 RepID=UPI0021DFC14E|nr:hypothetical protein [Granulicella aggregans]
MPTERWPSGYAVIHGRPRRSARRIARGFNATEDNRITGKATHPSPRDVIDVLTPEGKVRWCFTASQPPTISDSRTPFQLGSANSPMAACGP